MIRVQDIQLNLEEDESLLKQRIAKKLKIKESDVTSYRIFKKAIDARKKKDIKLVYTVDVVTPKEGDLLKKFPQLKTPDLTYVYPQKGHETLDTRPIVVGSGPCGMFAALLLAQMGYKPLVVERGECVEERVKTIDAFWDKGVLKTDSNVQFGEGGAGTFSDGKLTTQIKNKRCHKVLEELARFGAPEEIRYKNKPHIGTDVLRVVVKNIREEIERLGGTYLFKTQLTNMKIEAGKLKAVELNHKEWIPAEVCILAVGHSARDTFHMLKEQGLHMVQKPFSMGMRIEHLQEWINTSQYGETFAHHPQLGAAEYKLVHHASNGRAVYSFCMCPGGYVVASASEEGMVVTNGMSEYARDGVNANSAILVNVGPEDFESDDPLAGVELQRQLERLAFKLGGETYKAPVQTVGDFLKNEPSVKLGVVKPTYTPGVIGSNLRVNLPSFMGDAVAEALTVFGRKIQHFDHPEALLTGFETRSSSPIRMSRDAQYVSSIEGLYPAGEGAGYAGGITSAAVDGMEVAEAIIERYKSLEE